MKYRLKKDLLWLKAGEIVEQNFSGNLNIVLKHLPNGSDLISIQLSRYPDFFEPINEEDERDQEDIKRLESRGYQLSKKHIHKISINADFAMGLKIRCLICDDLITN